MKTEVIVTELQDTKIQKVSVSLEKLTIHYDNQVIDITCEEFDYLHDILEELER